MAKNKKNNNGGAKDVVINNGTCKNNDGATNSNIDIGGVLSNIDIEQAIKSKEIVICNKNEKNLTEIGYDLSFSRFLYSTKYNVLYKIEKRADESEYVRIAPGDTVLVLTKEAIWISEKYAGTIHSEVSMSTKGISNISTTVDPNWEGPLLIAFTNINDKEVIVEIAKNEVYETFATLIIHKLISPVKYKHPKEPGRRDILHNITKNLSDKKDKTVIDSLEEVRGIVRSDIKIGEASANKEKEERIKDFIREYQKYPDDLVRVTKNAVSYSEKKLNAEEFRKKGLKILPWAISIVIILVSAYLRYIKVIEISNLVTIMAAMITVIMGNLYNTYSK